MQSKRGKYEIPKEIFEILVDHVFLPKKISGTNPAVNIDEQDEKLLSFILDSIENSSVQLPESTAHLFRTMVDVQCHRDWEKTKIAFHIQSLLPGHMFGLYIRKQNCGLLIYAPPNGDRIVSTFQASVPNEIICSSPSDVQVCFF